MGMNPTTIFIVIPFILLLVTILYRYTVNGNEVNENMTEDMRNRSRIQRRENRRLRRAAEKERLMKEKQQAAQGETNTNPLFENNPTYNSIIS